MSHLLLLCPADLLPRHALWKSAVRRAEKDLLALGQPDTHHPYTALQWTLLIGDVFVGYTPEEEDCTMFPFDDDAVSSWTSSVSSMFLQYEPRIHRLGVDIAVLHKVYALRTKYLDHINLDRELTTRRLPGLHDLARRDKASEYCLRGLILDVREDRLLNVFLDFLAAAMSLMENNLPWEPNAATDREFGALVDLIGTVSLELDDSVYEEAFDYLLRTANVYLANWPSVVGEWEGYNGCDVVAIFCDFFKQLFLVLNAKNHRPPMLLVEAVRSTSTERNDAIGFDLVLADRRIKDMEVGRSMGANFIRAGDKIEYSAWNFTGCRLVCVVVDFLMGAREWVMDDGEELYFRFMQESDDEDSDCSPQWQVRDHEPLHFRVDVN